jgi:hypothetical protein
MPLSLMIMKNYLASWNKILVWGPISATAFVRMRISSKGRGKSGGARVISFTVVVAIDETEINLLYIYDKAERESISLKEIEELLRKNGLK